MAADQHDPFERELRRGGLKYQRTKDECGAEYPRPYRAARNDRQQIARHLPPELHRCDQLHGTPPATVRMKRQLGQSENQNRQVKLPLTEWSCALLASWPA